MKPVLRIQELLLRSRRMPWLVIVSSLFILAGIVFLASYQLRLKLREQLVGRDAAILHAVARMQREQNIEQGEITESPDDRGSQFTLILKVSKLAGVLGARLFDEHGEFLEAFPAHVLEGNLDPKSLATLSQLKPVGQFHSSIGLSKIFLPLSEDDLEMATVPLLIVHVPLQGDDNHLAGIGQFIIEGESIAVEFAALDRHLATQAMIAFLVGGVLFVGVISWSFRRLRHAHRLLAERTNHLLKANQELALAAKTSALGALTAHLIHGLSNPLSGLQNFVNGRGREPVDDSDADWQEAIRSTRRMQSLVGEIVRLLAAEDRADDYELSFAEMLEIISARAEVCGQEAGVQFQARLSTDGALSNRQAHLVILILENLIQNAIEASPRGSEVRLNIGQTKLGVSFQVKDQGPGFPDSLQQNLFTPCRSTKVGGNGIGLAISKQLANHLHASLNLQITGPGGSTFELVLPANALTELSSRRMQSVT